MQKKHGLFITIPVMLMVSFGWGVSFLSLSILLRAMEPMQMLASRWGMTALVFLVLILTGRIKISLRGKNILFLLLAGLGEPCAYAIFEAWGIRLTSAATSAIFIATIPAMTLLLGILFFHQKTSRKLVLSLILAFLGVVIATVFSPAFSMGGSRIGAVFMILAVLSASAYSLFSKKASAEFDAMTVTAAMAFEGAVFFNVLALIQGHGLSTYTLPFSNPVLLCHFLFLALFCAFVSYIGYNYLLSYVDPAIVTNVVGSLTTVIGVVAGILFSGDIWGWYTVVGMAVTVTGVWMSARCL